MEAEHEASGRNASVLEAEREKARARAERFNTEYKAPAPRRWPGRTACFLGRRCSRGAGGEESGEGRQFITGSTCSAEEEAKRAAAPPSGAMLGSPRAEGAAREGRGGGQARGDRKAPRRRRGEDAPRDTPPRWTRRRRPPRRTFWRSASTPSWTRCGATTLCTLRRGPHDHRGLHGVLRRVRPGVLRVDQRLQLQRGVRRRARRGRRSA